jgi:uncharacterized protein (TIGR03067 family)
MGFKVALVTVLVLAVPRPDERKQEAKDDVKSVMAKLQGEWVMVRAEFGNQPVPGDARVGQSRMLVQGDKLVINPDGGKGGNQRDEASFTIDLGKKPYAIDIQPMAAKRPRPEQGIVKGIFEVAGDTLQLTFSRPGGERPTDFAMPADKDKLIVSLTFERVRAK